MSDTPLLVVGLGNPGSEYDNTRHNIGFDVIDALATRWRVDRFLQKFHAATAALSEIPGLGARRVILMKPLTFMNRSGLAVGEAVSFYKIDPKDGLIVVTDDLDLPPGQLRLRMLGGAGGHNGLKSIIQSIGTEGFPRLRVGIGRSPGVTDHVLGKIGKSEKAVYDEARVAAADGIELVLREGVAKAMNTVNKKKEVL